jgi:hypothetical protein
MSAKNLQSAVMRRVYYSYAISIFSHVMFWQGLFLGVAALLLARWLHVASIFNNLLATQVGSVPNYMYSSVTNAVAGGEFLTVLTLLLAGIVTVSAGFKLTELVVSRGVRVSRPS